jgi:hypothetical protein
MRVNQVVAPCRRGVELRQTDGWLAARSENRSATSVSSEVTPFWYVADTITPFVIQRQLLLLLHRRRLPVVVYSRCIYLDVFVPAILLACSFRWLLTSWCCLFLMLALNESFCQAKVLTGGGDMRKAQVDVPLSLSHSCVWSQSWAQ